MAPEEDSIFVGHHALDYQDSPLTFKYPDMQLTPNHQGTLELTSLLRVIMDNNLHIYDQPDDSPADFFWCLYLVMVIESKA